MSSDFDEHSGAFLQQSPRHYGQGAQNDHVYSASALSPQLKFAEDREKEIERLCRTMAAALDPSVSPDDLVMNRNQPRTSQGWQLTPKGGCLYSHVWQTFRAAAEAIYEDRRKG